MTRVYGWSALRRPLILATILAALLLAVALLCAGAARAGSAVILASPCAGGMIAADTTWDSSCTISTTVTVTNGATLTIMPGVEARFNPGTWLRVDGGSLNVQGTQGRQVRLIGATAAQWGGVVVTQASGDVSMQSATIASATVGLAFEQTGAIPTIPPARADITDSLFYSNTIAISVTANAPRLSLRNNLLTRNGIGMVVEDPQQGQNKLKLNHNSFVANGIALKVVGQGSVKAQQHWWGAGGPVVGDATACAAAPAPGASDLNLICGAVDFTPASRVPTGRMLLGARSGGSLESELGLAALSDNDTLPTSVVTLTVPSGTFDQPVDLLLSGRALRDMPGVPPNLYPTNLALEVTAVAAGQELHQLVPGHALDLTITYTPDKQDLRGADETRLAAYYWDEQRGSWSLAGLVTATDPANRQITVHMQHLSRVVIMQNNDHEVLLPLLMR